MTNLFLIVAVERAPTFISNQSDSLASIFFTMSPNELNFCMWPLTS